MHRFVNEADRRIEIDSGAMRDGAERRFTVDVVEKVPLPTTEFERRCDGFKIGRASDDVERTDVHIRKAP